MLQKCPSLFRTKDIFGTLTYLEQKADSEHFKTSTMERFT